MHKPAICIAHKRASMQNRGNSEDIIDEALKPERMDNQDYVMLKQWSILQYYRFLIQYSGI